MEEIVYRYGARYWSKIYVLRLGHRPERDKRITTHVALVARAFGANGFVLADTIDEKVKESVFKVEQLWGKSIEYFEMGVNPVNYIKKWKNDGGEVVHLTMYGEHIDMIIGKIRKSPKNKLVVVGAEKVPRIIYDLADYNVAIGFQPHSEVAALAIFLDKLFSGRELYLEYSETRLRIIPEKSGKKVVRCRH